MRMISAHKRDTALKFGTEVAFVENNMELRRNGGGNAAFDENRHFNFFSFFGTFDSSQSSEINFFFS